MGISEIFCQMVSILFLLGITVVPREIEDNGYVFIKKEKGEEGEEGSVDEVYYGQCENGELD